MGATDNGRASAARPRPETSLTVCLEQTAYGRPRVFDLPGVKWHSDKGLVACYPRNQRLC